MRNFPDILKRKLMTFMPSSMYGKLAIFIFMVISLSITFIGRNERSGWAKIESPIDTGASLVSLIGWSHLTAEVMPLMSEDVYSVDQVVMFNGGQSDMSWRFIRSGLGFVASLFAPFLGIFKALLLSNYLSWAAGAWAAWHLTKETFEDEAAAFIAVLLVAGGSGWVFHIGDYGAHLMSFMAYYLGVLLIFKSRVWLESRPLKTHLQLGLYIALATLVYGSGLGLLGGYLLVALFPGRNRWQYLVMAAIIAFTARPLWNLYLNFLNITINNSSDWANFQGLEMSYWMVSPWAAWLKILSQGRLIETLAFDLVQFLLFFDSPLILFAGLIAFAALFQRSALWWFYFVFFFTPLALAIWTYSAPVGGLGYIIFGISILLYSMFAGASVKLLRWSGTYAPALMALIMLIIVSHFAWSTAHFWNYLGPVKTYFYPYEYSKSLLFSAPAEALSLTGAEPTPVLFGGDANLEQAGVYVNSSKVAVKPSFIFALLARFPFFMYIVPLILLAIPDQNLDRALSKSRFARLEEISASLKQRVLSPLFLSFIAAWIFSAMLAMLIRSKPAITDQWRAVRIPAGESIFYTVNLSDQFLEALEKQKALNPESNIWFFSQIREGACQFEVVIGGTQYLSAKMPTPERGGFKADNTSEVIKALIANRQVTVTYTALDDTALLSGWQRNGLRDRILETTLPKKWKQWREQLIILPAFEIRLRAPDSIHTLILAGY